jgi:hypothetical protein
LMLITVRRKKMRTFFTVGVMLRGAVST